MADGLIRNDWQVGDIAVHPTYGRVRVMAVKVIQHLTVELVHGQGLPRMVGSGELREDVLHEAVRKAQAERKGGS